MTDLDLMTDATIAEMDDLTKFLAATEEKARAGLEWLALGQNGQLPQVRLAGWEILIHLANGTTLATRFNLENLTVDTGVVFVQWPKGPDRPNTDRWAGHLDAYQATQHYRDLLGPDAEPPDPAELTAAVNAVVGDVRRHAIAAARRALIGLNLALSP